MAETVELRVEATPHRVAIYRAGESEPRLVQHAAPDRRPYIHPIVAPDGRGVITEDTPAHHPWQHGLYVGLNDVNGTGFWKEGIGAGVEAEHDGTFHPRPLAAPEMPGGTADSAAWAAWAVVTEWRDPHGDALLVETQRWRFAARGHTYVLDLEWTLHAAGDLTFGQYAYGGLFLRMPYRAERGGAVVNSEGQSGRDAEGRRARWVAVAMPLDGRADEAGIAMLDHPGNPEHPLPWRVDGQLGICPSRCIAGAWRLPAGSATTSRYRLLVFGGAINPEQIERAWVAFRAGSTD